MQISLCKRSVKRVGGAYLCNMKVAILNGQMLAAEQLGDWGSNRAFLYGDGLFETIRVMYGQPLWLKFHFDRLQNGLRQLDIHWPISFEALDVQLQTLIAQHKISASARIRLNVWRRSGGFFTPESNEGDYLIQLFPLELKEYQLNVQGLKLGDSLYAKQALFYPEIKSSNALIYVMAAKLAKKSGWNDAFLYHAAGGLAESSNSNVFVWKDGLLLTPTLESGCLPGVMRRVIIQNASAFGIEVREQIVAHADLMQADEVFLTNVVHGIQWVGAWQNKRYYKKRTSKLIDSLNQLVINSLTFI